MKAVFEHDLNDQDERKAAMRCMKSTDMAIVFFEIVHNMKKQLEQKETTSIDDVFNEIDCLMYEYGIIIDDLVD